jgi:hypothetical protein
MTSVQGLPDGDGRGGALGGAEAADEREVSAWRVGTEVNPGVDVVVHDERVSDRVTLRTVDVEDPDAGPGSGCVRCGAEPVGSAVLDGDGGDDDFGAESDGDAAVAFAGGHGQRLRVAAVAGGLVFEVTGRDGRSARVGLPHGLLPQVIASTAGLWYRHRPAGGRWDGGEGHG